MSKTLGAILTIGAAIVVNVIPGVGQALSVAIGASLASGVASAITLAGVTTALSAVGSAFSGNPAQRPETTETSRKSAIPSRKRAYGRLRLYGDWILFGSKSDGTPVDVWAFHDGRANQILQIYLNDDKITRSGTTVQRMADGRYRDNRVKCGYNLGLPTETAFADVIAELPGIWTTGHRGDGVVTGYLIKYLTNSEKFLETYPNGDDIQMSLAGEWSLVFDPRDPAQDAYDPSTWVYSDNALLAFLHDRLVYRGVDFDTQIAPQIGKWIAAADDCDAAVALSAGGSEKRYRLAMAYSATEEPAAVTAALLAPFDGWFCENERSELIVYSGRFYQPTVSIGPAQISSYSFQEHVAAEDAVNEITIAFVSAEHDYNTIDAAAWRNEVAIAASGREPVTTTLGAQIPSPTQGRRLAKRRMYRANSPCRGSILTTYGGRGVLGERYVNVGLEEAGALFYDGPVEIVGSPERDLQTGGVRFDFVAVGADIDAWNPVLEDGNAAVVGELPAPDPFLPAALTGLSVTANAGASLVVADWDASDHAERYLVELIVEP